MDAASALLGASRRLSTNSPPNGSQGGSSWGAPPTSPGAGSSNSWTTTSESSSSPNSGQWNSGSEADDSQFSRGRSGSLTAGAVAKLMLGRNEGDDKAGNLPSRENMSWFGWKPRQRANSEGQPCFSGVKIQKKDIANWLSTQESGNSWLANGRIRRSSSRDIEEAMSGGLPKADLYMPPI